MRLSPLCAPRSVVFTLFSFVPRLAPCREGKEEGRLSLVRGATGVDVGMSTTLCRDIACKISVCTECLVSYSLYLSPFDKEGNAS